MDRTVEVRRALQAQRTSYPLRAHHRDGIIRHARLVEKSLRHGAVDPDRVTALVDGILGFERAHLHQQGHDEHADGRRDVQAEYAPEHGGSESLARVIEPSLVHGPQHVPAQDVARYGKEDGHHGAAPVQEAHDGQRRPLGEGLGRERRPCAVAQHDERCPWPQEVVIEDEEARDAPEPVQALDLVPLLARVQRFLVAVLALAAGVLGPGACLGQQRLASLVRGRSAPEAA